jgi:hypothetical protein
MEFLKKNYRALLAAVAGLAICGAIAYAQVIVVPTVTSVGTTDLFADVVAGQPSAQASYATASQIANVPGYRYTVATTGFSITVPNGVTYEILNPAGTLATGTFTMMPNPGDGARTCFFSTQTQTAVTLTANTGQTIVNGVTAFTANTQYCYTYVASLSAWERSA